MTQDNKPAWQELEAERSENDPHEGMGLATMMAISMVLWVVFWLGYFLWATA